MTKGTATANANGQPTRAPVAKAKVANSVRFMFLLLGGSNDQANASVLAYMANEDGRNARATVRPLSDQCEQNRLTG